MNRIAVAAAVAATLGMGSIAQACPQHTSHAKAKRVHSYRVDRTPDRYYTGSYDYSPGYYNSYSPGYYGWDTGGYYNSYNNVGIGLGPFSIGF
ncbi:MAG: hypothetical protein ACR2IE_07490 [Candidatus Sumerlaeaceae bacterium]